MKTKLLLEKIQKLEKQILVEQQKKSITKDLIVEMKKIGIENLPYSYSSLSRFIDKETMNIHYNKHYKGYVKKLNRALSKRKGEKTLEDIVKTISSYNENISSSMTHRLLLAHLTHPTQGLIFICARSYIR